MSECIFYYSNIMLHKFNIFFEKCFAFSTTLVDLVKCIQNNKAKILINFMTKEVSFLVAKNIYFLEMFFFFLLMFGKGNVSDETLEEGLEKVRMK